MNTPLVLTELDMVIRLCLGFMAGAIIGFERSSRRQVAGLRTHILIATGATLLMLLSIYLPQQFSSATRTGDPGRIAAQVVSGMGFLGAGAIIRLGNTIRGLTTAASLWFVAAVGLAIGSGMFLVAAAAEGLGLIALLILNIVERKIFPTERLKSLEISFHDSQINTADVMKVIKDSGIRVQSVDINQSSNGMRTKLKLLARIPDSIDIATIAKNIKASGNVGKVEIKEKY